MATTKDVTRTPSGKIKYRGETFSGFNKPKRTPGKSKKSAVLAKKGDQIKLVLTAFDDVTTDYKREWSTILTVVEASGVAMIYTQILTDAAGLYLTDENDVILEM